MKVVSWTKHVVPVIVFLLTMRVVYLVTRVVVVYVEAHMIRMGVGL